MAYLLDSNLLIYSADTSYSFSRPLVEDSSNYVSAISKVETLGFHRLDPIDEAYLISAFSILILLPVTQPIIDQAVVLRQQRRMTLGDSLIAATALLYGLKLATRNVSDFLPIVGLAVYNPFGL